MTAGTNPWRPTAHLRGDAADAAAALRDQLGSGEVWSDGSAIAIVTEGADPLALLPEGVAPAAAARLAADLVAAGRPARLAFVDDRTESAGLAPAGQVTRAGRALRAFRLADALAGISREAPTQPRPEDLSGRARWFSSRSGPTS